MIVTPVWTGLLQAAFKHQNIVQGVTDAYYLRRPDIQLPVPPIATIDVPNEAIANLRDVYAVDADGNLYVLGPESKVEELGERKLITVGGVSHGEAEEDDALIDHELGTFFYGNISLAPDGRILSVSNLPSFYMYGPDGATMVSHRTLRAGTSSFEVPPEGAPFWEVGAGDVTAGADSFIVGGAPLFRVDCYGYDGRLRWSRRTFEFGGRTWDLEAEQVAKISYDRQGRVLASSARNLFLFSPDGEVLDVHQASPDAGVAGDFHLWIGVDKDGKLWSQFYKGKEVAYAAFSL